MQTLREFLSDYREFNPEPEKAKVKRPYQYVVFWPFLIVAVGTLMMSGIRTYQTFGTGEGTTLLIVESLLAVLAVEVGMGGNLIKLASYRKNRQILKRQEPRLAIIALLISGLLSIIIALFTNMVQVVFRLGIETSQLINLINIISVFLKGGVIPILGIVNLEIIAYYFAKHDWDNEIANRDHTTDMNRWRKAAEKSYQSGQKVTATEFKYRSLPESEPELKTETTQASIHPEEPITITVQPEKSIGTPTDKPVSIVSPLKTEAIEKSKLSPAPKKKSASRGAVASERRNKIRDMVEDGEKFNDMAKKGLSAEFGVSTQTIEEDIDKANAEKYDKSKQGMF